jgi:cell division protein ZapA (FtsZ GTPase activity inhibitor)
LFTTIVGALAGAGIGAWAAGHISEKNKAREQLTKEIRDTNAAIMLALGVMNCGVKLKKQHVKALKEDYEEQRKKCREIKAKMAAGQPQTEFPKMNLLELHEIAPPVAHLQEIVLSRLSTAGRALASVTELADAVINLNTALKCRNELITKIKHNDFPPGARHEHLIFGLPYGNGQTNEEYRDTVDGISSYTDDIIFFGSELCADLCEHAEVLIIRFKKSRLGGQTPEVHEVDLSGVHQGGWMPVAERYVDWTSGFQKSSKEPRKRRWFSWCNRGQ